jgi:hypothetical protein
MPICCSSFPLLPFSSSIAYRFVDQKTEDAPNNTFALWNNLRRLYQPVGIAVKDSGSKKAGPAIQFRRRMPQSS